MFPNMAAELARQGITKAEMARRLNRRAETVSNWMNGSNCPDMNTVIEIRDTLFPDLSLDYLISSEPYISDDCKTKMPVPCNDAGPDSATN